VRSKLILAFLLCSPSALVAHGLGPADQVVRVSERASFFSFEVEALNMRKDVNRFTFSVQDEEGESVPFSSIQRDFTLPSETSRRMKLFLKNDGRKKYKVCTWANPIQVAELTGQKLQSVVCVSLRVQYY